MAAQTERETKFELDPGDFEQLKKAGHVYRHVDQCNVYYDRAGRLASQAVTFRMRLSAESKPMLTLKLPISQDQGTRVVEEFEHAYHVGDKRGARALEQSSEIDWVSKLPAEIDVDRELPPEVTKALLTLGVNRLEKVGCVHNRRYFLSVDGCCEIALDELALPGGRMVYEAEIESNDPEAHTRFKSWIRSNVPEARESPMNKFERLLAAVFGSFAGMNAWPEASCDP